MIHYLPSYILFRDSMMKLCLCLVCWLVMGKTVSIKIEEEPEVTKLDLRVKMNDFSVFLSTNDDL